MQCVNCKQDKLEEEFKIILKSCLGCRLNRVKSIIDPVKKLNKQIKNLLKFNTKAVIIDKINEVNINNTVNNIPEKNIE